MHVMYKRFTHSVTVWLRCSGEMIMESKWVRWSI